MKRSQSELIFTKQWCVRWNTDDVSLMPCRVALQFFYLLLKWMILYLRLRESHHSYFLNTALIHLEDWTEWRKRKYCYPLVAKPAEGAWNFFPQPVSFLHVLFGKL